ncbi:hypothetical protein D104_00675 [Marinomonas profundimaris]|uniref:Uncharacterized protein n=1 Tax=Marinomonas profundimaris TaxID=1208321 RepID=W1S659_9GAMM|nr:hypothetical protein D104_00675 [Marinomonas profundimaris]
MNIYFRRSAKHNTDSEFFNIKHTEHGSSDLYGVIKPNLYGYFVTIIPLQSIQIQHKVFFTKEQP